MPTVSDYVFAGAERLRRGPHPERALQDAEFLLMHVLGKDRAWMLAYWKDEIGTDASDLFNSLTGYSHKSDFRRLLVAPMTMRDKLAALIRRRLPPQVERAS